MFVFSCFIFLFWGPGCFRSLVVKTWGFKTGACPKNKDTLILIQGDVLQCLQVLIWSRNKIIMRNQHIVRCVVVC